MSNNYSEFSQVIECVSTEGIEFLESLLNPQEEGDYIDMDGDSHLDIEPCEFNRDLSIDDKALWVRDFEGGGVNHRLIDAIKQYQLKFDDPNPVTLEWSDRCDKPRVGEFGGGVIVILRGHSHWMTTRHWADEKIAELNK